MRASVFVAAAFVAAAAATVVTPPAPAKPADVIVKDNNVDSNNKSIEKTETNTENNTKTDVKNTEVNKDSKNTKTDTDNSQINNSGNDNSQKNDNSQENNTNSKNTETNQNSKNDVDVNIKDSKNAEVNTNSKNTQIQNTENNYDNSRTKNVTINNGSKDGKDGKDGKPGKPGKSYGSDHDDCWKTKSCKYYRSEWEKPCKKRGECGKYDSDWDWTCKSDSCSKKPKWNCWGYGKEPKYRTKVLPYFPVWCAEPTYVDKCGKKVWVPAPTTYTVHDCPCTVTEPEYEQVPVTLLPPVAAAPAPPAADGSKVADKPNTLYTPVPTYPADEQAGSYAPESFTGAAAGNAVGSLAGLAAAFGLALAAF